MIFLQRDHFIVRIQSFGSLHTNLQPCVWFVLFCLNLIVKLIELIESSMMMNIRPHKAAMFLDKNAFLWWELICCYDVISNFTEQAKACLPVVPNTEMPDLNLRKHLQPIDGFSALLLSLKHLTYQKQIKCKK